MFLTVHLSAARRIHISHSVQIEVQQTIEAHKLGRTGVGCVKAGDKVIFQNAKTKATHCHSKRDGQDEHHQQRQKLEPHI